MEIVIVNDGTNDSQRLADVFCASISQTEELTAIVLTEKQYKAKKESLSDTYIVFIGDTAVRDSFISMPSFKCEYHKYNMRYGWIGKQAILYLSNKFKFTEKDVNSFVDLYNETFDIEIGNTKKESVQKIKNSETKKNVTAASGILSGAATVGTFAVAALGGPITLIAATAAAALVGGTGVIVGGSFLAKDGFNVDKIRKHSGELLLKKFIDEGLSNFLGE